MAEKKETKTPKNKKTPPLSRTPAEILLSNTPTTPDERLTLLKDLDVQEALFFKAVRHFIPALVRPEILPTILEPSEHHGGDDTTGDTRQASHLGEVIEAEEERLKRIFGPKVNRQDLQNMKEAIADTLNENLEIPFSERIAKKLGFFKH